MSVKLVLEGFDNTGQVVAFLDWLGEVGEQYLIEWFEECGVDPIEVDYTRPIRIKDDVVTATIKSSRPSEE